MPIFSYLNAYHHTQPIQYIKITLTEKPPLNWLTFVKYETRRRSTILLICCSCRIKACENELPKFCEEKLKKFCAFLTFLFLTEAVCYSAPQGLTHNAHRAAISIGGFYTPRSEGFSIPTLADIPSLRLPRAPTDQNGVMIVSLMQGSFPGHFGLASPAPKLPLSNIGVKFTGELKEGAECCVCLNQFSDNTDQDDIWQLNHCLHLFHEECIAGWYSETHKTCPLCRQNMEKP